MCKNLQTFLLFILILTTNIALGKLNKTKSYKDSLKKSNSLKETQNNERVKRSISNVAEIAFPSNRGKRQINDETNMNTKYNNLMENHKKIARSYAKLDKDEPFWGNRGRRDNSVESYYEYEYPEYILKHCEHCSVSNLPNEIKSYKDRREDFVSPFWGSRGRRNSLEVEDISDPFWGNRGRRQEKEPFWGNRGRRTENEPFWGNRGRREEEPFWGNRGRREDVEPFWGNRGRREDEPFWGNRGRRIASEQNTVGIRKEEIKDSILSAINGVESDIEKLSRLKKGGDPNSFWTNRGRYNKLTLLFNNPSKTRALLQKPVRSVIGQNSEPGTVLDNRMYVDVPNYILVERASRSSGEEDPYYVSRGKKYYFDYSLEQAARDRRGAIEEIVKNMRNDPYYIARGKKDVNLKNGNSTLLKDEYTKAKDLICATIEMIMVKDSNKVKRDINDSERDRRTTLKKLAAQLQIDPYFVSRGKKNNIGIDKEDLQEFINNIAENCN